MPSERLELSKEGIKFSYLRFLSDSAAGYIVLLLLIAAFYQSYPIFGLELKEIVPQLSDSVKIFVLVLTVFLLTPLGLIINSISWFILGWWEKFGPAIWFDNKLLAKSTEDVHLFSMWKDPLCITKNNFYYRLQVGRAIQSNFYQQQYNSLDHIVGISTLTRNIILITIIYILNNIINWIFFYLGAIKNFSFTWTFSILIPLLIIVLSLLLNSLLNFYYGTGILSNCYILSLQRDKDFKKKLRNIETGDKKWEFVEKTLLH